METVVEKSVNIAPQYLNKNLDESVTKVIKERFGDRYCTEGYIVKDSIKLLRRSIGERRGSHFKGDLTYDVAFTAKVVNPRKGDLIKVVVTEINSAGFISKQDNDPLQVLVFRDYHQNQSVFNDIEIGEEVEVIVQYVEFDYEENIVDVTASLANDTPVTEEEKKTDVTSNIVVSDIPGFDDEEDEDEEELPALDEDEEEEEDEDDE